jgi:hypothetical protein
MKSSWGCCCLQQHGASADEIGKQLLLCSSLLQEHSLHGATLQRLCYFARCCHDMLHTLLLHVRSHMTYEQSLTPSFSAGHCTHLPQPQVAA